MYGKYDRAKEVCGVFKDIFGENFFLEVMYHGISEERAIIPLILKLSSDMDIPVVCTNDSHYIYKDQGKSQEVLMCMSQSRCMKDPKRLKFNHMEFYLKSAEEMAKVFGHLPHVLENSVVMAERIDTLDIEKNLFGGMRLPDFQIPEKYNNSYDYLCELAWEGMKRIGWDKSKPHVDQLKLELGDVKVAMDNNNYDFSTYFLIVRDYIEFAEKNDILVGCGRGSGYASILLRCLGITYGVDPIEHGLLWERFLGFDDLRFIKESDFGFQEDMLQKAADKEDFSEDILE
jgi:DNA polymerase-3 subunit alpha